MAGEWTFCAMNGGGSGRVDPLGRRLRCANTTAKVPPPIRATAPRRRSRASRAAYGRPPERSSNHWRPVSSLAVQTASGPRRTDDQADTIGGRPWTVTTLSPLPISSENGSTAKSNPAAIARIRSRRPPTAQTPVRAPYDSFRARRSAASSVARTLSTSKGSSLRVVGSHWLRGTPK
jgi:hypothetical protein